MSIYEGRLGALRQELTRRNLDGFIAPRTDEHLSEYVGEYAERLAWLTGFRGSAGTAVVLPAQAAIFVDGRYTLQVREEVDGRHWSYQSVPQTSVAAWLRDNAERGARVGYDPWLHTTRWVVAVSSALLERDAQLVPVDRNPIDAVWRDQPHPSNAPVLVHPADYTGRTSAEKRRELAATLSSMKADTAVLASLDSIAWTFNVRGRDIIHTPVVLAYALVHADATADLFVAPEKLTPEVIRHLGSEVRLHPRAVFVEHLATLSGKRVCADPDRAVAAIFRALDAAGAHVIEARDVAVIPKAKKNATEIAGHKAAQIADGVALCRFLHWLSQEGPKGTQTEISAATRLQEFREAGTDFRDLSFDTISGFGPNGAVIHYSPNEKTNRRIEPGTLYLFDSGGQYLGATTDVTRTVAIGAPQAEMRDRFTRVLKGHIAIARAVFPAGTRGGQLDALARQYLWAIGLDYAHGTGHGIGSYLGVHEAPHRIINPQAFVGGGDEPLLPGMFVSNEPGYYKTGAYGIRIENLVLVEEREIAGAESPMLGFKTLTLAPIDRTLVDVGMLSGDERSWLNEYHADVARLIGPHLQGPAKTWLLDATSPLN